MIRHRRENVEKDNCRKKKNNGKKDESYKCCSFVASAFSATDGHDKE